MNQYFHWAKNGLLILLGLVVLIWLFRKTMARYRPRKIPLPSGGMGIPSFSDGTIWSPLRSVELLYEAMFGGSEGDWWQWEGWGTDEATIFLTLGDKTQDQLAAILNEYEAKYQRDLLADFRSELGSADLARVLEYYTFLQE